MCTLDGANTVHLHESDALNQGEQIRLLARRARPWMSSRMSFPGWQYTKTLTMQQQPARLAVSDDWTCGCQILSVCRELRFACPAGIAVLVQLW